MIKKGYIAASMLLASHMICCVTMASGEQVGQQITGAQAVGGIVTSPTLTLTGGTTMFTVTVSPMVDSLLVKRARALPRPLSMGQFFVDICTRLGGGAPRVSDDIVIDRPGVKKGSTLYGALQKCALVGVIEPRAKKTDMTQKVSAAFVGTFLRDKLNIRLDMDAPELSGMMNTRYRREEVLFRIPTYHNIQALLYQASWGNNHAYYDPIIQSPYFSTVADVYETLKRDFHYTSGGVNEQDMMYGAVQGMVGGLHDTHSVYFAPDQTTDFVQGVQGEYYGIGTYVDSVGGYFTITATIKDSPAMKAGLIAKDRVVAVDGRKVPQNFTLSEVIAKIKGPEGTTVQLDVIRDGIPLRFDVKRAKIQIPLLQTKVQGDAVVWTLTSFGRGLEQDFAQSLQTYKTTIDQTKKVVFDLRNNGGGYTDVVISILQNFVPANHIIAQYDFADSTLQDLSRGVFSGDKQLLPFADKHVYILVNEGTASASEIMAGAIKEYIPTATVVGKKTYGKGSMQTIMGLPNGGSVKYSIGLRSIGPKKKSIEHTGITPDVIMEDDRTTTQDEVMDYVLRE